MTADPSETAGQGTGDDAGESPDSLPVNAVVTRTRRFNPGLSSIRMEALPWTNSGDVERGATSAAKELVTVAIGFSPVAPGQKDWRFTAPARSDNPVLKRMLQIYLGAGDIVLAA